MTSIIEVNDLTYKYGSFTAVDSISFRVERGSLFGFLGPNGAGKSTTISVLTTLYPALSGTVSYSIIDSTPRLLGRDDAAIRSKIGVVFQDCLLDKPLTVRQNLAARAKLYGVRDLSETIRTLRLEDILSKKYAALSGGQRRRVDIARALLASPEILFLDEPTTGLDPQSRNLVWEAIETLRQRLGITVFLTTHYMEEANQADQVTIIDHGNIIACGTPAELKATHSQDKVRLRGGPALEDAVRESGLDPIPTHDGIDIHVGSSAQALSILNAYADLIEDFEVIHGTMDDVFLNLTGSALRED